MVNWILINWTANIKHHQVCAKLISGIFHQKLYMVLKMDMNGVSSISLPLINFLSWNYSLVETTYLVETTAGH